MLPRLRCRSGSFSAIEIDRKETTFGRNIWYAGLALLALVFSMPAPAQQPDPEILDSVEAAADWLLTQQTPAGAYPWEIGGPLTDEAQGAIARGMLVAYDLLADPAYLNSALATGDYLILTYPRQFSDGDPDIHSLDVLFLHELSRVSGDLAYENFLRANLWGKLRLGLYGENNNQDIQAWAATIPVLEDYDHWVAAEPFYRALPAIAAHYSAETEMADALVQSVIQKFNEIGPSDTLGDLPGMSGAILAAVNLGFNIDPTSGRFASFDTTQDFVDYLLTFQRPTGDWPPHTGNPPGFVGDTSTTSWAIIALKAWDTAQYQSEIDNGIDFILGLQQPDGQYLTNPGYPPDTVTGVQVHAEAIIAVGTDDGLLLDAIIQPVNQAPLAVGDTAATAEGSSVNIDVLSNDSDVDGALDPASVQITGAAANGATSVDPATGIVTYTPDPGFSGSDSFDYTVADDLAAESNAAQVSVTVTPGAPSQIVVTPLADTYVSQTAQGSNFGTSSDLQFRGQPGAYLVSYVKFDVDVQGQTINGATLRLWLSTPSGGSGTLYRASNNYRTGGAPWTELGLTWLNADLTGTVLSTISGLDTPQWFEVDVSSSVLSEGPISFAFTNSSASLGAFSSREGAFAPELVLDVADGTPPTVTITSPTSDPTYATSSSTVTLAGSASDNVGVTSVTWVNDRGGSGTASGTDSWSIPSIALQSGSNQITVTASDAAGNSSTDVLTVTYTPPDVTPPTVTITSPTSAPTFDTESATLSLGGTASDNVGVTSVTWANDRGGSGTASGTDNWSVASITLQEGVNQITVTAFDAAGNSSTDSLTVTYTPGDITPPTVTITSPTSAPTFTTTDPTISLGGTASDDTGVDSVTWVNDRGGSGTASGTDNWSVASIALQPGVNQITVTASDAAGNSSTDVLTVTYDVPDVTPPTVTITSPTSAPTFTTSSATIGLGGTASDDVGVDSVTWVNDRGGSGTASGTDNWSVASITLQPGVNQITVTASDAAGNSSTDVLTVTYNEPDVTPPTVTITSPTSAPTFTTENATISLGGTASDDTGVTSVTWVNDRGGSGTASGTTSWSVASVALQLGANQITVTATDAAGNSSTDVLTVTREAPNQPPTATITAPANGSIVGVGQPVNYTGTATDPEDGTLPASAYSWEAARVGGRFFPLAQGATGGTASAQAPGTYIIRLTVQDSEGLIDIDEVTITAQ